MLNVSGVRMTTAQTLQQWFSTSAGAALLQREREWNGSALKRVYGMHLMQLGMSKENFAAQAAEVYHPFVMAVGSHDEQSWAVLEGRDVALPIVSESLSAVILPHLLEFSADPHQVLREVTRVLTEDGEVVIYGFSPWSYLNLSRRLRHGRYLSPHRVKEWLSLLGYQVYREQQLPLFSWRWRSTRLYSGAYQLVAKRSVAPLSPIFSPWKRRTAMATGNLMGCE